MNRWLLIGAVLGGLWLAAASPGQEARSPVYIEDSPDARSMFEQARQLTAQDRVGDAVKLYQKLVEQYGHKLVAGDQEQLYSDVADRVWATLSAEPQLLAAYRRRHEDAAQRELMQAAAEPHNLGALTDLAERYRLTAAGLEAGLRAAALLVERAEPAHALSILSRYEGHPDLASERTRSVALRAMALLMLGDAQAVAALEEELDGQGQAEAIAALRAQVDRPGRAQVVTPWRLAEGFALPETLSTPLWRVELEQPPGGARDERMPALPVARGATIYINDGSAVTALDRYAGRVLWRAQVGGEAPEEDRQQRQALGRMRQPSVDVRSVCVDGDSIYAVLGGMTVWPAAWRHLQEPTTLVRISRQGQLQWRVQVEDLEPGLDDAAFHGTPVVVGDRVVAMLRRKQMSGFEDAFLAAFDARSGKLIWRRHLSSAIAASSGGAMGDTRPIVRDGRIYISDNIGSVASLDAYDGSVRWLHIHERAGRDKDWAMMRHMRRGGAPTPTISPLLLPQGLLVIEPVPDGAAKLLDPETGRLLRTLPREDWAGVASALALPGGGVVALREMEVMMFDAELSPRWSQTSPELYQPGPGRVVLSDKQAAVVAHNQLLLLSLDDGSILEERALDTPGRLLALDGQLVLVDAEQVRGYMPWAAAHTELTRQIDLHPADPDPALALAKIAASSERWQPMLEALDAAQQAVIRREGEGAQATQRKLFDQLLAFVRDPAIARSGQVRPLLDRMALIVAEPRQQVVYQLEMARHMVEADEPAQAVEHYQAVLMDPVLAAELFNAPEGARQAGLEAKLRLGQLIEDAGPQVYAHYAAMAQEQLRQLNEQGQAAPRRYIELSERFPFAPAAFEALVEASDRWWSQDDRGEALKVLGRAYRRAEDPAVLARVVTRLVERSLERGRADIARQWLSRAGREHPDLSLTHEGEPIAASAWLEMLQGEPVRSLALPTLRLPIASAQRLPGRTLTPNAQPLESRSQSRLITLEGRVLRLFANPNYEQAWQREIAGDKATLLWLDDAQALVWLADERTLLALDPTTGQDLWEPRAFEPAKKQTDEAIDQIQPLFNQPRLVRVNGRVEQRLTQPEAGVFVEVSETLVCLIDRVGQVTAVSRQTGRPLWQRSLDIDQVNSTALRDEVLAIGGTTGLTTDAPGGAAAAFDANTGQPLFPAAQERKPVSWVGLSGESLVRLTAQHAAAQRLDSGAVAWRVGLGESTSIRAQAGEAPPPTGRLAGDCLLIIEENGSIRVLDAATGRGRDRLVLSEPNLGRPPGIVRAEPLWHVHSSAEAAALDDEGRVLWRDAISQPDKQLLGQAVGRDQVVLLSRAPGSDPPPQPVAFQLREAEDIQRAREFRGNWQARVYILERQTGRIIAQRDLESFDDANYARPVLMLGNAAVLSTDHATLLLHGSPAD